MGLRERGEGGEPIMVAQCTRNPVWREGVERTGMGGEGS